jgi:hypothetical protein
LTGLGTAALWALAVLGASSRPAADSLVGPGPAVPFVAQGSLLCGGAAAAMLERFWGARGVYAEDYAHLVREEEGGIRTTDLALALRRNGYMVRIERNDPELVLGRLEEGVPAILLLDDGAPPLHYVVLTAVSGSEIHYHDPKLGPDRAAARTEVLARWSGSGYWALLAEPVLSAERSGGTARHEETDGSRQHPASSSTPSSTPHPNIVEALERVRSGDYMGARALARRIIDERQADTLLARRILATARFRSGDGDGALEEWNRLAEPAIDLVDIRGASGTRHDVLAEQTGLRPARLLTRPSLALARRRLADMPAVETSRIDYQPLADGTVEVRGFVTEPPTWPSPLALATQATQALLDDRTEWEAGPFLGLGERWRFHAGWSAPQRRVGSSLSAPLSWPDAVATVSIEWTRERYDLGVLDSAAAGAVGSAERARGGMALRRWVAPDLRLDGGFWLERWDRSRRLVSARVSVLSSLGRGEDVRVEADLEAWTGGGDDIGRASMRAVVVRSHGARRASRAMVGGTVTSRSAPPTLWPGAGTGEIRAPLLRGHPLATGDVIHGAALAPRLLHATLEHRVFSRLGPLRLGGAVFVDAAHVSGARRREPARTFVDFGLGAFAASGEREAMLSLAMGAGGPVLSARVGLWPIT